MADTNCIPTCTICGNVIARRINKINGLESKAQRKYCSTRCRNARPKPNRKPRTQADRLANIEPSPVACRGCGITAWRKVSHNDAGKYCSRECHYQAKADVGNERQALARMAAAWQWKPSAVVVIERDALIRIARYVERRVRLTNTCAQCSTVFATRRNGGLHRKLCQECRAANVSRARRVCKARRRARERGLGSQSIDPLRVFDRDGWRCVLCGVVTPKRLRGTIHGNAPELDHIVPISQGGLHTWGNVQCTCRNCNQEKGATARGQLGFSFAVR